MYENRADESTIIKSENNDEIIYRTVPLESMDENKKPIKSSGSKKNNILCFVLGFIVAVIVLYIFISVPMKVNPSSPDSIFTYKKLIEAERVIDKNFISDPDKDLLAEYVFAGLVAGLEDPYAAYYTKEDYEYIKNKQQGYYVGIGVTVANRIEDNALVVVEVSPDSHAEKAGILVNDIIKEINGIDISEMTSSESTGIIVQSEDDMILLDIYREETDESFEVYVEKENIEQQSVTYEMLDDSIGYISISSFTGVTSEQFKTALEEIKNAGAVSLIIDLRNNGGGLVQGVCDTLRNILPKGTIFYSLDKYQNKIEEDCDGENELDIPFAVVVNSDTASASEIFAGSVQDYEMAPIIGTQTYGKGIVQDAFKLSDGSVIKLTVSHYYTPDGNDIHEKGITPDIVVEDDEETQIDEQLEAAVEYLKD